MFDLRKSYNRRYYRRMAFIWIRAYWKMARLSIAHWIIKFAFVVSPDAKQAIEARMLKKPRKSYYIIDKEKVL